MELRKLKPGEFLPSRRKMAAKTGAGRQIIEKILADEIASGRVVALPRKGYVRNPRRQDLLLVNLAEDVAESRYHKRIVDVLVAEAEKRGIPVRIRFGNISGKEPELPDKLFVVAGESPETVQAIRARGKTCITILPRFSSEIGGTVRNSEKLIYLQLAEFFRHGARRIAYTHQVADNRENHTFLLRREAYYRWMAEHGLQVWPHHVCFAGKDAEEFRGSLEKMFTLPPRPDAVICAPFRLRELYSVLRAHSLRPMFDVRISCEETDDVPVPPPLMIRNTSAEVAKLAWILMERALAGADNAADTLVPQWNFISR